MATEEEVHILRNVRLLQSGKGIPYALDIPFRLGIGRGIGSGQRLAAYGQAQRDKKEENELFHWWLLLSFCRIPKDTSAGKILL